MDIISLADWESAALRIRGAEDIVYLAGIDPPELSSCDWSQKRWRFEANAGPKLMHEGVNVFRRRKRGEIRRDPVPSHRLWPFDRSRYTADNLPAIRARAVNFRGQPQR